MLKLTQNNMIQNTFPTPWGQKASGVLPQARRIKVRYKVRLRMPFLFTGVHVSEYLSDMSGEMILHRDHDLVICES